MISAVCFTVSALCIAWVLLLKRQFFSPVVLYLFTQSFALGLAYLKWHKAMTDFHAYTWAVLIAGTIAFVSGSVATRIGFTLTGRSVAKADPVAIRPQIQNICSSYNWSIHLFLTSLLAIGVFAAEAQVIAFAKGIPLFSGELGDVVSRKLDIGKWAYFLTSAPLVVILFGIATFSTLNASRRLRIFAVLGSVLVFTSIVLVHPSRTSIFLSLGIMIILRSLLVKRFHALWILLGIGLAISAFVALGALRDQYATGRIEAMAMKEISSLPYKYVANNFWNLDYALNPPPASTVHPTTYGIDWFSPVTEHIYGQKMKMAYGWDDIFNRKISKVPGLNTVHYLWEIKKDWGDVGVVLIPFLAGAFLTLLFIRVRNHASVANLLLYSLVLYLVAWWWFLFSFKNGLYTLWILVIIIVTWLSQHWQKQSVATCGENL